jgi:hypothetical protein
VDIGRFVGSCPTPVREEMGPLRNLRQYERVFLFICRKFARRS